MDYRLVLFDFDGTLADSFTWFTHVVNDAADRFGFRRVAPQDIDMLRGKGAREVVAHLGVPFWKMPAIASYMRARKANDVAAIGLFDGTAGMLRQLREAGRTLAIVSSNSEANVRAILGPDTAALVHHYGCGARSSVKPPSSRKHCAIPESQPHKHSRWATKSATSTPPAPRASLSAPWRGGIPCQRRCKHNGRSSSFIP